MTIALGVLGSDGIVMGADSEISSEGGEIKSMDTKIVAAGEALENGRRMLLAGAGSVGYFQSVRFEVLNIVARSLGDDGQNDVRIKHNVEHYMTRFHQEHVTPYAKFKAPPQLSLLIGTWFENEGSLWATEMGTVHKAVLGYLAIGGGASYAYQFLHGYFHDLVPTMTFDSVLFFVLYVLGRVKSNVQGCGQDSHVAVVSSKQFWNVPEELITRCEYALRHFHKAISSALFYSIGATDESGEAEVKLARAEIDALRQEIRVMSSATDQTRSVMPAAIAGVTRRD